MLLRAAAALAVLAVAFAARAQDDPWLKLETAEFTVLSQLDEDETRAWAQEFGVFVDMLGRVLPIKQDLLPPLTAVLFDRARDFAPYRPPVESGSNRRVVGLFVNSLSWSVIGVPERGTDEETRRTMYHEAVHWYTSADPNSYPLWFEEGLAEVFSGFETKDGTAQWGRIIPDHLNYLRAVGLRPLEEVLRTSSSEALAGRNSFYPQSWAFVHFLLFGGMQSGREALSVLLREWRASGLTAAFESAFGRDFDAVGADLRRYVRQSSFNMISVPVESVAVAMTVSAATRAEVELALARLAIGGENFAVAHGHLDVLLDIAADRATTYDAVAELAWKEDDAEALVAAVGRALALGSRDALTYRNSGRLKLRRTAAERSAWPDELLTADQARDIADDFIRALNLRLPDYDAFQGFIVSMLSLDELNNIDRSVLAAGSRLYPGDGLFQIGLAKQVRLERGIEAALSELRRAFDSGSYEMTRDTRQLAEALRDHWIIEGLIERLDPLMAGQRYAAALAALDEVEAAESDRSRAVAQAFADMRGVVIGQQRLLEAVQAVQAGRRSEAVALLRAIAGDEAIDRSIRRQAERRLDELGPL